MSEVELISEAVFNSAAFEAVEEVPLSKTTRADKFWPKVKSGFSSFVVTVVSSVSLFKVELEPLEKLDASLSSVFFTNAGVFIVPISSLFNEMNVLLDDIVSENRFPLENKASYEFQD